MNNKAILPFGLTQAQIDVATREADEQRDEVFSLAFLRRIEARLSGELCGGEDCGLADGSWYHDENCPLGLGKKRTEQPEDAIPGIDQRDISYLRSIAAEVQGSNLLRQRADSVRLLALAKTLEQHLVSAREQAFSLTRQQYDAMLFDYLGIEVPEPGFFPDCPVGPLMRATQMLNKMLKAAGIGVPQ